MTSSKNNDYDLEIDKIENVSEKNVSEQIHSNYLNYSMSVVRDRSLPNFEDGLKPVHRRIIYSMWLLKLLNSVGFKKSARVVGDVIGKYHPHGDVAVYEAMVIMSQKFKTRYTFIDGQGNWGSIDDPKSFAAMRYTECRLTPIAECLLRDLPFATVDFKNNYDATEVEPYLMPSSLPFTIINGSSGIAVGVSTDYPSHNLCEIVDACVDYLKRPKKANIDTTMEFIKGPDFPNGGVLMHTDQEIKEMYKDTSSKSSKFTLRADYDVITHSKKKGDWSLLFKNFPFNISPESIISDLVGLLAPETRAKDKKISKKQLHLKQVFGNLIDDFSDESEDQNYSVSIKNKNKDITPEQLASLLFENTRLETTVPFRMLNLVDDKPASLDIFSYIVRWCEFRLKTMKRRFEFLLKKAQDRIHILEGRLIVIDNIEKVIKIIKNSEQPKEDLIKKFKLSEIQASDILEMKLRSVSRLSLNSIVDELESLRKDEARYEILISDEKALRKEAIKELESDKKKFGDERRTKFAEPNKQEESSQNLTETLLLDKIADENVVVALSEYGWISWKAAKQLNYSDADFKFKNGDAIKKIILGNRSQNLNFIDSKGKSYSLSLNSLSGRSGAEATNKWFKSTNKMIDIMIPENMETEKYIVSSTEGYGFITTANDMFTKMTGGKNLLNVSKDHSALPAVKLPENPTDKQVVVIMSSSGKFTAYPFNTIKEMSKGKGVALMGYKDGERIISVGVTNENGEISVIDENKNVDIINWKQIQKVLISERKSTNKGKDIPKLKNPVSFYVEPPKNIDDVGTSSNQGE